MTIHRNLGRLSILVCILVIIGVTQVHTVTAQVYVPPGPNSLWQSWILEDKGTYQLFFLQQEPGLIGPTIGRAESQDLLHWRPLPSIRVRDRHNAWDDAPITAGTTIKQDGRYWLYYGVEGVWVQGGSDGSKRKAFGGKPLQVRDGAIGVMTSVDGRTWAKPAQKPVIAFPQGDSLPYKRSRWQDISLRYDAQEKLWHGFLSAQQEDLASTPPGQRPRLKPCIGHVTSSDLQNWVVHPPVLESKSRGDFISMEMPDYFELGGRHYLLFTCGGSRKDVSGRTDASGTWYALADAKHGPYHVPADSLLLGSGMGRIDHAAGRVLAHQGELLLIHPAAGMRPSLAPPKVIKQNADGSLWLAYWSPLNTLEKGVLFAKKQEVVQAEKEQTKVLWLASATDAMITCDLKTDSAAQAGLLWRWDGEHGAGVSLDNLDTLSLLNANKSADGIVTSRYDKYQSQGGENSTQALRILLRGGRAEVYVNDRWVFGATLPMATSGQIGLMVRGGAAMFQNIRIAEIEPLEQPKSIQEPPAPAETRRANSQWMFYKPTAPESGILWDTWLHYHEGRYYLFHITGNWNFALATSDDGVHWTEYGRVFRMGDDSDSFGTGQTWKSPNFEHDQKFYMCLTERRPHESIFFAESVDLIHWSRLSDECESVINTNWYKSNGRWDNIRNFARPAGGWYGCWCANPINGIGFALGETLDGKHWQALKPPIIEGNLGQAEVAGLQKIGDKYYAMYHGGGMTLVADNLGGPYRKAAKNSNLLHTGNTYFTCFCPHPDGLLVTHHSYGPQGGRWPASSVYCGLVKKAVVDEQGTLRLAWWGNNEKLKHQPMDILLSRAQSPPGSPVLLDKTFDVDNGVVLEGTIRLPEVVPGNGPPATPRGLYLDAENSQAAAILVGARGVTQFGTINPDGSGFKPTKTIDREMAFGKTVRFRLCLKHHLLELYLDDILIEVYSLPSQSTGRIGVIGGETVGDLRGWR